jgi:uncharacterized protein YcbX
MLYVSEIYIYPIKSLAGISVREAEVTDRGFKYDRRWMLVDENNIFLSQREIAQMALFKITLDEDGLTVKGPADSLLLIPYQPQTNEFADVSIWDDVCMGQFVSAEADAWFSEALDIYCRLVYMPDDSLRAVDPRYAPEDSVTSFSDAYPFLLIGQASLDDLNKKLQKPVPINRFRPNIVFAGGDPYEEDTITSLQIGSIQFQGVKLCARCPIPNIDQLTAERSKEPIKTLASYRTKNNKVMFGQNLIHEGLGIIKVGDEITVQEVTMEDRFVV